VEDGHDAVERGEQKVGPVPQGDPAMATGGRRGRDRRQEDQDRRGGREGDRVADDQQPVGGEGVHLNGPARQQGAEGDADVGHGAEIGTELLRAVPSVTPDERAARGQPGRLGPGGRAHREDERPESVRQHEARRRQCLDDEGCRVDAARSVPVREMADGDAHGQ
jgi:hypothetical protein